MAADRRPARGAHPPLRREGQLLGDGRDRALRPVQRDLRRPRAGRAGGAVGGGHGERPLPRDLEPGLHAVRPRRRRRRSTPLPNPSIDTGAGLERVAAVLAGRATRTTTPTSSSRCCAPPPSWPARATAPTPARDVVAARDRRPPAGGRPSCSPTASSPATRAAATCCAASCAAPCATACASASRSRSSTGCCRCSAR